MERRSARQRKSVNYTTFAAYSDEDSEDDFASPPPAKKAKEKTKDVTQTRPESRPTRTAAGTVEPSTAARGRPSRDEKQFNRDLQRVLEASQQSSSVQKPPEAHSDDDDFCPDGGDSSGGCSSGSGSDSDFDASPQLQPKKGRGKATKGTKVVKSKPKSSKKMENQAAGVAKRASKSTGRAKKTQNAPTPPVKLPATPAPMSPVPDNLEATRSPALPGSRPAPGLGVRRMPKWTPPARANPGCETTRKALTGTGSGSGGGPVIRVGLSRTARIKPLHTRPTIPNT